MPPTLAAARNTYSGRSLGEEAFDRRLIAQIELVRAARHEICVARVRRARARSRSRPGRDGRRRRCAASAVHVRATRWTTASKPSLRDQRVALARASSRASHHLAPPAARSVISASSRASRAPWRRRRAASRLRSAGSSADRSRTTALAGAPCRSPCSSTPSPRQSSSMPSSAAAASTNSRTLCCSPVAITKSSRLVLLQHQPLHST